MRSDRGLQTRISLANWLESVHFSTSELCLGSNYSPPCDKIDKFSVDRRAFVGTRPRLFVNGKNGHLVFSSSDESQFAFGYWKGKALLGGFVTRAFDCEYKAQKNKTHDEKKS